MKTIFWIVLLISIAGSTTWIFCASKSQSKSKGDAVIRKFLNKVGQGEDAVRKTLDDSIKVLKTSHPDKPLYPVEKYYTYDSLGVFSNHAQTMASNAYINAGVVVDDALKRYLARTDYLEGFWISNRKKFQDLLAWQYTYHLASNTIRVFEWTDFSKIFGPVTKWAVVGYMNNMNLVQKHAAEPFCTRPYNDIGGTGLGVSCCRVFNPSDTFNDVVVSCVDYSFRSVLDEMRNDLSIATHCYENLVLRSTGLPLKYSQEAALDMRSGQINLGNEISQGFPQESIVEVASLPLFALKILLIDKCL